MGSMLPDLRMLNKSAESSMQSGESGNSNREMDMSKKAAVFVLTAVLAMLCSGAAPSQAAGLKICRKTSGAAGIGDLTVRPNCRRRETRVKNFSELQGEPGASFYEPIPSSVTVTGIIGGDFDTDDEISGDWRVYHSFPAPIGRVLTDADVIVASTNAVNDDCIGSVSCLSPTEQSAAAACTGTADAPTAPAGKVCIYPALAYDARDIDGLAAVIPGETSSRGFAIDWNIDLVAGSTYFMGSWAYTQP